ncbi:ATPase [Paenibacillus thiaminolyticus]|uniref:ATPase n=2 Tax=Paenibacillus thiaminolyticus TaxID=49283 RepID=UPI002543A7AE|nr:ATPase [Paenibacillus thiaminolyticus]WII35963.1 ATPase [Paenibacillus thiaminolyticus]
MMMKKGIGKRAKEILRKLLQGRGMRRLAIGLALMIPVAGYAGDAHGWAAGQEARSQSADAVKVHIPGSPQHAPEIHQR